jgi:glutamine synthetase
VSNPKARRIEIRFPDPMNSGYLTFAALMMAGLDGIKNQIDPGAPSDKDLYDLPPEEEKNIPTVCHWKHSLDQALEALDKDRDASRFLKAGGDERRLHRRLHRAEDAGSHQVPRATHPLNEYQRSLYYAI